MQIRNKIIAAAFLVIMVCSAVNIKFYDVAADILTLLENTACVRSLYEKEPEPGEATAKVSEELQTMSAGVLDTLPYKTNMVEMNGSFLKMAGTRSYYNEMYGMNITTDGYNVGRYEPTSTDYEVSQMVAFKEYLDSKGVQLLYVNEPVKYIDDAYYTGQFGGESYINRNADLFLSRISEAGIDYLDLRENIAEENKNPLTLFYRGDHHWTVPASKWAASKIAEKLNEDYGYDINLSLYEDEKFNIVEYKESWLGEQGRLVAKSYIGLDDYTMMEPLYDTSYSIISEEQGTVREGDFGVFIDKSVYQSTENYYTDSLWHYSYSSYISNIIHNNNANYGKVLILGDSYEASMLPFLSLGIQDIQMISMRNYYGSIRELVETGDYDTVIIAYAQFMIGAHDDETNANYNLFALE